MAAVVCIVGYSGSGKTRVGEALVRHLTARGYRVAAIKHCPHGYQIDRPGSDSERLLRAGACLVIAAAAGEQAVLRRTDGEPSLERLVAQIDGEADLVLAEGFSSSTAPKVLVIGNDGEAASPRVPVEQTVAVVAKRPMEGASPSYTFTQMEELASMLEERFLRTKAVPPAATVVVDGQPIALNTFASNLFAGTVRGMLSALKGVPESPRRVQVEIRLD